MTRRYRDLTPAELAALQAYAAEKGRKWKSALSEDWYYARRPGELQALRNELGPRWLLDYRLPAQAVTR